ncbi:MAG TPA: HAD-IA family hydrolase [Gammaproteobacteria bacterium]|nr:HAD-IA family hydrolase [Gammaproteobacteria bacterium]
MSDDVASHHCQLVLLDLDGTLADTGPDLAYALNTVRAEERRPALPYAHIRPQVSHGARALIRLGFGGQETEPDFERRRQRLLDVYRENLCVRTKLFPGMAAVLAGIERLGLRWGVVTNKPAWLTDPLLAAMQLDKRVTCVVSGDTVTPRKPHPNPLLHAARAAGVEPAQCVYIGDAERDVQAGKAAGMHTLVAAFGYLDTDDNPRAWGADAIINQPSDILVWLNGRC